MHCKPVISCQRRTELWWHFEMAMLSKFPSGSVLFVYALVNDLCASLERGRYVKVQNDVADTL